MEKINVGDQFEDVDYPGVPEFTVIAVHDNGTFEINTGAIIGKTVKAEYFFRTRRKIETGKGKCEVCGEYAPYVVAVEGRELCAVCADSEKEADEKVKLAQDLIDAMCDYDYGDSPESMPHYNYYPGDK